jgi:hypothetical protein
MHIPDSDRGTNIVKQPWVICGNGVAEGRIAEVEKAGVKVIPVELIDGMFSVTDGKSR